MRQRLLTATLASFVFALGVAAQGAPVPSAATGAKSVATKLWPQLTPGIYNHANVLVMRCKIAEDGLTVTDTAWDSYQVAGCGKRWTINMGLPMDVPLKNYRFAPQFAGLPINLTVEFYNPAKPWEVKENYQEIILLGGKQRIGLPPWFHVPVNRLGYDFDEGKWFPSGWTLPRGKYALWQGAAKARQQDRKGQCPLYDFGFTHVSPFAMSHNGSKGTKARRAHLFPDAQWIFSADGKQAADVDPTDPQNWQVRPIHEVADSCAIVIPDFELPGSHAWKDSQYEAFARLMGEVRQAHPDTLIGCWAVGVINTSYRIFDSFWEGKPTGVVDLNGARQWREKYDNPSADVSPVFKRCNLNFGTPAVYWIGNSKPSQLYAFLQEWEQGKLACPTVPNVLSSWIQVEFVDGYPLSQYRFTDAKGTVRFEDIKHQVPASSTYALSLFGHCVMDGLQSWECGTIYSEELQDYSDWRVNEQMARRVVNGVEVPLNYYLKYFGFYNFHILGMWQASQNKDIIDSATPWEMPDIRTSSNGVWRVGDERYPSFVNYYREPLARVKLSGDGRTLLVVCCNPYNGGVQTVSIRRPGTEKVYAFELVGDFPIIRRFPVR